MPRIFCGKELPDFNKMKCGEFCNNCRVNHYCDKCYKVNMERNLKESSNNTTQKGGKTK
jgi:hypothetical protein